jgi:hypothetical protein
MRCNIRHLPTLATATNDLRIADSETVSFQVIRQSEQANIFRLENVADNKALEFAGGNSLPPGTGKPLASQTFCGTREAKVWRLQKFADFGRQTFEAFQNPPTGTGKLLGSQTFLRDSGSESMAASKSAARNRQTLAMEKLSPSASCEPSEEKASSGVGRG